VRRYLRSALAEIEIRSMKKRILPILIAAAFSSGACATDQTGVSDPITSASSQILTMSRAQQVEYCEQDLARTLGVERSSITTVTAEPVTWRSGALGCPIPGRQYTQGQVSGFRIVLKANEKKYSYHASKNGTPFYCSRPRNRKPTPLYQDR